jgi:hypothetical protein
LRVVVDPLPRVNVDPLLRVALYHIAQPNCCKSAKLRYAELIPASHTPLRTALVTAMAFPHHKAQEKTEE